MWLWRTKLRYSADKPVTIKFDVHEIRRNQIGLSSKDVLGTKLFCTPLSANYIRLSGFLCCEPDGLELTTD